MLRPGEIIGLPGGLPDPSTGDIVVFRWAAVLLAVAAGAALARGRQRAAVVLGATFAVSTVAFWGAALGQPYGLFADPDVTRRAAEVAVAAESGRWEDGPVVGEPRRRHWTDALLVPLSRETALTTPTLLPFVVLPASALLLAALSRGDGALAALLWLAFSTGDLETLRAGGFLPGMWARPGQAAAFVSALAVLAAATRLGRPRVTLAAAAVVAAVWIAAGAGARGLDPLGALLLLTLDQGVWLWLAAWSMARGRARAAAPLLVTGALLAAAPFVGLSADPWAASAFFRAGLVVASIPALRDVARWLGQLAAAKEPLAVGGALLFGLGAASATAAWWDPPRWDVVARHSQEPVSDAVAEPMAWLQRETPPDAVVLAAPEWAPFVAILAGRRVLRAPSLVTPTDDERRRRLEKAVLAGEGAPSAALLQRYGLRYVLAAPGDFASFGVRAPHELAERPHLALRHVSGEGFRVYEIVGTRE